MIRNPIEWQNGARCACAITFDIDADSLIHIARPTDGFDRLSAITMGRYGPTVAVPRILETYRRLGLRQTFFMPAWCMETYPETVEAILAAGHEIGHHSYLHENPATHSDAEQAHWFEKATEIHLRMTGTVAARLPRAGLQRDAGRRRPADRPRVPLRQLADGRRHPLPDAHRGGRGDGNTRPLGHRRLAAFRAFRGDRLSDAGARAVRRAAAASSRNSRPSTRPAGSGWASGIRSSPDASRDGRRWNAGLKAFWSAAELGSLLSRRSRPM